MRASSLHLYIMNIIYKFVISFRFIFELLSSVSIGFDTKNFQIDLLDKIINYISQDCKLN